MATIDQVIKELQEMKSQKGNTGETRIISFVFGKEDATLGEKAVLYVEGEPFIIDESVFNVLNKYEQM